MNVSDEILCKPLVWHSTLLVVCNSVSIVCVLTSNDTEIDGSATLPTLCLKKTTMTFYSITSMHINRC